MSYPFSAREREGGKRKKIHSCLIEERGGDLQEELVAIVKRAERTFSEGLLRFLCLASRFFGGAALDSKE